MEAKKIKEVTTVTYEVSVTLEQRARMFSASQFLINLQRDDPERLWTELSERMSEDEMYGLGIMIQMAQDIAGIH